MGKVILFAGCSFTAMEDSWARQLAHKWRNDYKSQVIAKHGAGNDFIARSIIYEIDRQRDIGTPVTHVFVMWSGPSRHELMIDTNIFNKLKPWSTELSTYKRQGEWGEQPQEKNLDFAWAKSGGKYGGYNFDVSEIDIENKMLDNYFENYYKVNSNEYFNFKSLESFHYAQLYCKANNVTLINLTFRDIISPIHAVISPSFVAEDKSSIHNYAYLYKAIDWTNWFFYKDFGGLREWTLDNTNKWDDGYDNHPHAEAHAEYIKYFIKTNLLNRGMP